MSNSPPMLVNALHLACLQDNVLKARHLKADRGERSDASDSSK